MQPTRPLFALPFALLLVAGGPSSAVAAVARTTLPVEGWVAGSVTVIPLPQPGSYRLENHGTGTMSHLGRIETAWAIPAVELDLVNRVLIVSNIEWTGTITAANGDQILGRYTFPGERIPFRLNGDVIFDVDLEITGGTGRFASAGGRAAAAGRANIYTGQFQIDFDGEMSTLGSTH